MIPLFDNQIVAAGSGDSTGTAGARNAQSKEGKPFGEFLSGQRQPAVASPAKPDKSLAGGDLLPAGGKALPATRVAIDLQLQTTALDEQNGSLTNPFQSPSPGNALLELPLSGISGQEGALALSPDESLALLDPLVPLSGGESPAEALADPAGIIPAAILPVPPEILQAAMVTSPAAASASGHDGRVMASTLAGQLSKPSSEPGAQSLNLRTGTEMTARGRVEAAGGVGLQFDEVQLKVGPPRMPGEVIPSLQQELSLKAEIAAQKIESGSGPELAVPKSAPSGQAAPLGGLGIPQAELNPTRGQAVGQSSTMATAVGDPKWNGEFAARIGVMVNNGMPEAKLQLSPPELGRLEVKISTDGDQAKVLFTVQNVAAREAIEQAMPRLREMLEQSGLQLAHSEVADQSNSQERDSGLAPGPFDAGYGEAEEVETEVSAQGVTLVQDSVVDYYV